MIQINNPDTIWDYMFNDDAADALFMIAKNGLNGKTYSVGSGLGMRIEEFIRRILEVTRSNVKIFRNTTPFQVDCIYYLVADMNELENDVKYISPKAFKQCFLCYFDQIKFK